MTTRVLRCAALTVAATSLTGCVLVPAVGSLKDEPAEPAATSARQTDVVSARSTFTAALARLSVINEGSYTLWLTSKEKGESERTYFAKTRTQYDQSRGMTASVIDAPEGTVKVRAIESKGVYVKLKAGGKYDSCWYRMSYDEFTSIPGLPFALDMEEDSAFATMLEHGKAVSIKPDPDHPSSRILRFRAPVVDVLRVALPGVAGQFAYDVKGIEGDMDVKAYTYGNVINGIDFDLTPVFDAIDDLGLVSAAMPGMERLRSRKPRGALELGDMEDSFTVSVPKSVCPPGAAPPDFTEA